MIKTRNLEEKIATTDSKNSTSSPQSTQNNILTSNLYYQSRNMKEEKDTTQTIYKHTENYYKMITQYVSGLKRHIFESGIHGFYNPITMTSTISADQTPQEQSVTYYHEEAHHLGADGTPHGENNARNYAASRTGYADFHPNTNLSNK